MWNHLADSQGNVKTRCRVSEVYPSHVPYLCVCVCVCSEVMLLDRQAGLIYKFVHVVQ